MRRLILMAALVAVLSACNESPENGVRAEPDDTKLQKAYEECDPSSVYELADGNKTILVNGAMADDITDLACMMLELDTPEYIVSAMDHTTAMMGRQHEEDEGISYDWSYHPDNGLDMTIHED